MDEWRDGWTNLVNEWRDDGEDERMKTYTKS